MGDLNINRRNKAEYRTLVATMSAMGLTDVSEGNSNLNYIFVNNDGHTNHAIGSFKWNGRECSDHRPNIALIDFTKVRPRADETWENINSILENANSKNPIAWIFIVFLIFVAAVHYCIAA
jgi:hypothetical protein